MENHYTSESSGLGYKSQSLNKKMQGRNAPNYGADKHTAQKCLFFYAHRQPFGGLKNIQELKRFSLFHRLEAETNSGQEALGKSVSATQTVGLTTTHPLMHS